MSAYSDYYGKKEKPGRRRPLKFRSPVFPMGNLGQYSPDDGVMGGLYGRGNAQRRAGTEGRLEGSPVSHIPTMPHYGGKPNPSDRPPSTRRPGGAGFGPTSTIPGIGKSYAPARPTGQYRGGPAIRRSPAGGPAEDPREAMRDPGFGAIPAGMPRDVWGRMTPWQQRNARLAAQEGRPFDPLPEWQTPADGYGRPMSREHRQALDQFRRYRPARLNSRF